MLEGNQHQLEVFVTKLTLSSDNELERKEKLYDLIP